MKFSLIFSLLLVCGMVHAQDTYLFELNYQESSTYKTTMTMTMNVENMEGPDAMAGMKDAMSNKMDMEVEMTTGKKQADGVLPIVIGFNKMDMATGGNSGSLPGFEEDLGNIKIHGNFDDSYEMKVDSITGAEDNPMMSAAMNQGVSQLTNAGVTFPETPLKIGESFELDLAKSSAMTSSMPGAIAIAKYTLVSVKGNTANFTIAVEMSGSMGEMMQMNGSGEGTMTYDLTEKYMDSQDLLMIMSMNMQQGGEKISFDMKVNNQMVIQLVK